MLGTAPPDEVELSAAVSLCGVRLKINSLDVQRSGSLTLTFAYFGVGLCVCVCVVNQLCCSACVNLIRFSGSFSTFNYTYIDIYIYNDIYSIDI